LIEAAAGALVLLLLVFLLVVFQGTSIFASPADAAVEILVGR
jgi:hypothetical protein